MNRHFNKSLTILLISIFFSLAFITLAYSQSIDNPQAIAGILDLSNWNLNKNGIIALDGQWEFYWQKLYTPKDFIERETVEDKEFIILPRAWNKYVINGKELSGNGYATYRLLIHNLNDEIISIKIPRIFTAYKLWVNGESLASAGKVGTDISQMTSQYLPQVIYASPENNIIEIVIQVSNFRHRSGGILESIQIGTAAQISELRTRNLTLELFLFGSLFIIGFYHIALFIYRTKDKSTLYFGVYSLLISARTLLVGEIYFIHLFPSFNWEIAHKIQTLAYYIGVLLIFLFLKSTFPNDISRKVTIVIQSVTSGFATLVLFTPARVFTHFNSIYQIFTVVVILYYFYIVIYCCYKRRESSYLIGIGIIVLALFSLNDLLFYSTFLADSDSHFLRNFIKRGNLSSWGLLVFVFTQSLVIAKKFSKTFSKAELLSEKLQEANIGLEDKVHERTLALEASKEELKKSYEAVSRSEKSLQSLMQNISHDLRTPLSAIKGYANAIVDGVADNPRQQNKYLKRITEKVDYLIHMVEEMLDLSKLQSRQMKLEFNQIPLDLVIEDYLQKFSFDMNSENITFAIHYPIGWKDNAFKFESMFILADTQKLERVFANLLNNALKFTPAEGNIEVSFSLVENNKKLLVEISDTGIGIPKDELDKIFERFYMVSKSRRANTNSSGLGLAIVKEIVEHHGGEIWAESDINKGSSFFFTLPIYNYSDLSSKLISQKYEED